MELNRNNALSLLNEYTKSESLLKHAECVEKAMLWYAKHFDCSDAEIEKWGITGLLHDFDYEMYPEPTSPNGHPYKGNEILKELSYPEDIREAIMGHAEYTNVSRTSLMAKALFAVDELSGLVFACSLVRPDKCIANLKVSSVRKKFKNKKFAAGCNRDDILKGAKELNIELDQHFANIIEALS